MKNSVISARRAHCFLFLSAMLVLAPWVLAAKVQVQDEAGQPLNDAVVWALPLDTEVVTLPVEQHYQMDQVNRRFVPHVLPVPVGALVDFPNSDSIMHHVYSFSAVKTFEIKLYKGRPQTPLLFSKPGVVELGCNIHDWMLGYIVVVDTPLFAKTDAKGEADLTLASGRYRVSLWYHRFDDIGHPETRELDYQGEETLVLSVIQTLRPEPEPLGADELDGY